MSLPGRVAGSQCRAREGGAMQALCGRDSVYLAWGERGLRGCSRRSLRLQSLGTRGTSNSGEAKGHAGLCFLRDSCSVQRDSPPLFIFPL